MIFTKSYIKISDTAGAVRNYAQKIKELSKIIPGRPFEVIGHRAGSFQEYPFDFDVIENPVDISILMDRSFNKLELTGIEIDVQTITDSKIPGYDKLEIKDQAVVTHNPIKTASLSKKSIEYMKKNSLEMVLSYFIAEKYNINGKKIYIEIKIPKSRFHIKHPGVDTNTRKLIERTSNTI